MILLLAGALAFLIALGYALTLLLPLTLFEASFLLLALIVSMFYIVVRGNEFLKQIEQEEKAEEASAADELRFLPSPWVERDALSAADGISPEALTWEKFLEYLLARDLWPLVGNFPAFSDLSEEERRSIISELAGMSVTLLRTNDRVFQTARVTRKDVRPLLMRAALPQVTLAHLGELVELMNVVLENNRDVVRLIAAHQEWPSLNKRE